MRALTSHRGGETLSISPSLPARRGSPKTPPANQNNQPYTHDKAVRARFLSHLDLSHS